jgi:hypothetical protein
VLGRRARTVLRGPRRSNAPGLPDNTIVDNADVLEQALQWLPAVPDGKQVVARGDSAMATQGFVSYARAAGVAVSVSLPLGDHPQVQAAIHDLHRDADAWTPAVRQTGQVRDGAHVAELADVPLGDHWPTGLRIIVRREPLHPGAQQTFADIDGHRFTAVLTDLDGDAVTLEAAHRARARIEDRIRDAKDTGLRSGTAVVVWCQPAGARAAPTAGRTRRAARRLACANSRPHTVTVSSTTSLSTSHYQLPPKTPPTDRDE